MISYLSFFGIRVLSHSYVSSIRDEVDIIALDGQTLVFIEVKSLSNLEWEEADIVKRVDKRKRNKIRKCAIEFMKKSAVPYTDVRFDVVSVTRNRIVHYKGVEI